MSLKHSIQKTAKVGEFFGLYFIFNYLVYLVMFKNVWILIFFSSLSLLYLGQRA